MDIGARVAEARLRAGLTQSQLASSVGLERSALAKIETGARRVSAVELAGLARELRQRIDWFVEPGPAAIVSYRNANPGLALQPIDDLLEEIVRDVEFVQSQTAFLQERIPGSSSPLESMADAERWSGVVREWLGLAADQPVHDLGRLVETLGLLVFAVRLGEGADAGTVLLKAGGVSIVNGDLQVGRRRLALAHELGHYLLADPYTTDWRVASEHAEALESRLDRFARALLLPRSDLERRWAAWLINPDETVRDAAVRAGSFYRVDMSTLARRLDELGLADGHQLGVVRSVRTRRPDILEKNLVVSRELEPVSLPEAYERAVLRLYRGESISEDRALGLLWGVYDTADLPDLPPKPESEIWAVVS